MLPVQWVQVWSLVGELRSHMLHGKEKKNEISKVVSTFFYSLGFYNSHQPGPSKPQSDLYQEGATWVRQGECLWVTCVKLVWGDWGCCFLPLQSLCHYHPLELPTDDAGMEECRVSGSRQHLSAQAGAGKTREARCGICPSHRRTLTNIISWKKWGHILHHLFIYPGHLFILVNIHF